MATTGLSPALARPAAKVTACCSAIPRLLVELAHTVIFLLVLLGELVPLALLRDGVDQNRPLELAHGTQGANHCLQIMSIDGSEILEAQFLEKDGRHEQMFQALLDTSRQNLGLAAMGKLPQQGPYATLESGVQLARSDPGQVLGEGAHVGRNAHLVIVEYDDHIGLQLTGVVHPFEGQTTRQGTVANHGDHRVLLAASIARHGITQSSTDRGAGVADPEHVVFALAPLGKTADAVTSSQGGERLLATREQLVAVSLMAHIPDDLVLWGVEDGVQGDGQLHHAQAGPEVPTVAGDRGDDLLPYFVAKLSPLVLAQGGHIGRSP
jgi:hypothetical protein